MPPWLRRLFSRTYRNALAAEAAGDYTRAAEHYALAGLQGKVAEMHLVKAKRVGPADRANALDDALRWLRRVEDGSDLPPALIEELSNALLEEARALSVGDPRRRSLAEEAARLHEEEGRFREAAEAFVIAKKKEDAVRCYEAAGDIEAMERLLEEESLSQATSRAVGDAFDEYESALAGGDRILARAALRRCCAEAPGQGYERMLSDLEKKLPQAGVVDLRMDGVRHLIVGATPAILGRGDAHVRLRHAGISRRHAAVDRDESGFHLRDAGSRNGTILAGLPLAGRVPLVGSGVIGLGDQCTLQYSVGDGGVELEVLDGPDRGLHASIIKDCWRSPSDAFRLRFRDGFALVDDPSGGPLTLNGSRTADPIIVLAGDVVESPTGDRLEVDG